MQFSEAKERRLVPCRRKGSEVVKLMYRYGTWNMSDWKLYSSLAAKMPRPVNAGAVLTDMNEIKRDFMECVLEPRRVYTLIYKPSAQGAEAGRLRDADPPQEHGGGVAGNPSGEQCGQTIHDECVRHLPVLASLCVGVVCPGVPRESTMATPRQYAQARAFVGAFGVLLLPWICLAMPRHTPSGRGIRL